MASTPLQAINSRVKRWVLARQGRDGERVVLGRRRIYILPTRSGLVFAGMCFLMLLASMNYSSSLGFALTFLLASLGFVAMHHCHAMLDGLELRAGRIEPVFAGQAARVTLRAGNPRRAPRLALQLADEAGHLGTPLDLPAARDGVLELSLPTRRRGRLKPGRLRLFSTHPFGLFRAWTWLHLDLQGIVYPAPAPRGAAPPPSGGEQGERRPEELGQEDFRGLRGYHPGDSPRHIAWQAYARERGLQVKQFSGTRGSLQWLDWNSLPADWDAERRLAVLCRQVLDAHERGDAYGLLLPGRRLEPARGEHHKHACLEALALHGLDPA